jgi:hypothetical protein
MAMAWNNTPLPVDNPLQPTQGDFLMAAAIMYQQGKFGAGGEYQVAGDVIPPERLKTLRIQQNIKTMTEQSIRQRETHDVLSRALGGTQNILNIVPEDPAAGD